MNSNYLNFENKFRGDREKILNIFSAYEPLIEMAIEDKVSPILIDIGCGRGEWLQRCQKKFFKTIGIESDKYMAEVCREHGLNVVEGDAIDQLSNFDNNSISVITIFHVIEHLNFKRLLQLIYECRRILSDEGLLIMETPSIDNLIVSTNLFYTDHTHINPINAEAISFHLKESGFYKVKYYYINGGPLQNSTPLKITRIFNGIAQDLCVIATKNQKISERIFSNASKWEPHLNQGLSLFDAAIEYDNKLESWINDNKRNEYNNESENIFLREEILLLKEEIYLLKSRLRIFIYVYRILNKIKNIFMFLVGMIKKILISTLYRVFEFLINFDFVIPIIMKILDNSYNSKVSKIRNKLKTILDEKSKFKNFNNKLLAHFEQSNKSKDYLGLLTRKRK